MAGKDIKKMTEKLLNFGKDNITKNEILLF